LYDEFQIHHTRLLFSSGSGVLPIGSPKKTERGALQKLASLSVQHSKNR
jgi:hypothetical protein